MMNDEVLLSVAAQNLQTAGALVSRLGLFELWRSAGAEPQFVGSVRTGLLMNHLDIDLHVYSERVDVEQDFKLMGRLAANPDVVAMHFRNGLQTEEQCLEWHCQVLNGNEIWSVDMIHIVKGSRYDGYFEEVADRLCAVLTPEMRKSILRLKYEVGSSIPGIVFCQAVVRDGIRTRNELDDWLKKISLHGIMDWMP